MEFTEWDNDQLLSKSGGMADYDDEYDEYLADPLYDDNSKFLDVDASSFPSPVEACSAPGAWPSELPPTLASGVAYSYQPLRIGPWIRILRLKPGSDDDPIKCSIQPSLLDDVVGQYDALSYVWGPDNPSYSIEVNGGTLAIRENLFRFLARLRSPHESLDLWADAICIDQHSTEEKSHQVQQMRKIYSGSRTTRLWLGQGDRKVNKFLRWTAKYSRTALLNPVSSAAMKGLNSILDNHYWTRLWIVQEVIVSPEVQVYVSQKDFSWADFIRCCKLVAAHIDPLGRFEVAEKLSRSTMLSLHRQRTGKSERSFPDFIRSYCNCRCFDLRDRVFGLMGLVNDFAFEVDYDLSRLQLFQKITHTYPAQFAEDLAEVLWITLEVFSEIDLTLNVQSSLTIPIRVQECGSVIRQGRRLTWSQHPKQILLSNSYFSDAIDEGERSTACL